MLMEEVVGEEEERGVMCLFWLEGVVAVVVVAVVVEDEDEK